MNTTYKRTYRDNVPKQTADICLSDVKWRDRAAYRALPYYM